MKLHKQTGNKESQRESTHIESTQKWSQYTHMESTYMESTHRWNARGWERKDSQVFVGGVGGC